MTGVADILKLCGIALLCVVGAMLLRNFKGDTALLLRIGGTVLIYGVLVISIREIADELLGVIDVSEEKYISVLTKALGIALCSKICADICRDCGESTIASGVELGGKVAIFSLCIPLIGDLMNFVSEILRLGE